MTEEKRQQIMAVNKTMADKALRVFTASLIGFVLLNPVHLLFINLVTDCFPALALGMEKAEPDTMRRPPRNSKDGIFAGGLGFDVIYQGLLVTIITIAAYLIGSYMEFSPAFGKGWFVHLIDTNVMESGHGMTMAFLAMSMCEIFHSFNMRSQRKSVFSLKGQNMILWAAADHFGDRGAFLGRCLRLHHHRLAGVRHCYGPGCYGHSYRRVCQAHPACIHSQIKINPIFRKEDGVFINQF